MQCPHCGAEVPAGNRFCPSCRKRVVAPSAGFDGGAPGGGSSGPPSSGAPRFQRPQPPSAVPYAPAGTPAVEIRRPGVVTLLAVLNMVGGLFLVLAGAGVGVLAVASRDRSSVAALVLMAGLYLVLGLVDLAAGIGLWSLKEWGRQLQIVISAIGLLGFPCGTLISILVLVYLLKPGVKLLFSGRAAEEMTPQESAEVAKVLQGSGAVVAIVAVAAVLVCVAIIGIIAAIAIPSLLRARVSANEAATIGRVRTVISAEAAYASSNGGFADTPDCLRNPGPCLPGGGATTPYVDASLVFDAPTSGYVLRFHPGPAAPPFALATGRVSPSSLQSFAVTASPAVPNRTGVRFFCGDASGRVCSAMQPIEPGPDGACPATCQDLR
jgi:type IV pilus assembly protein PilA